MTFTNMARGKVRARGEHDCVPVDVSRRLTQHLRRLDEHRSRIEYVERTTDDVSTEVGQLSSRLDAVERRLIELQVAARSSVHASAGASNAVREHITR